MPLHPTISWTESGKPLTARWQSESGARPPQRVIVADDTIKADTAYRLVCEGTAILWRGDFHQAKQLLEAISRRIDNPGHAKKSKKVPSSPTEAFHLHRQAQSQRARTLAMLLLPFDAGHVIPLRRAPDVRQACSEAYGEAQKGEEGVPYVASLRELLGLIGAHEWRRRGVEIPALNDRIHPHYGVFSPVRGEYVQLVADTPLPSVESAFDIGTGTGVLAAVLAKRGVKRVIATDMDARALACASDNILRLGLQKQVQVVLADLFPSGKAPLIVCNPPWIPARPSSKLESAVYDEDSAMLRGFLSGLAAHLTKDGEGWLILSDLAEHLGLRSREQLLEWIDAGRLKVVERLDVKPHHPKSRDDSDPLYAARKMEVTSLWRLAAKQLT